ncbi:hypothetical protein ACTGVQ_12240, partial [Streptococcus suis]
MNESQEKNSEKCTDCGYVPGERACYGAPGDPQVYGNYEDCKQIANPIYDFNASKVHGCAGAP